MSTNLLLNWFYKRELAYLRNINDLEKVSQSDEISQAKFCSFGTQDCYCAVNKLPTSTNLHFLESKLQLQSQNPFEKPLEIKTFHLF